MRGPEHHTAARGDVLLTGEAGGQHAQERIDDNDDDQRQHDKPGSQGGATGALHPRGPVRGGLQQHHESTPWWPKTCASLFAPRTIANPTTPLISPAAAAGAHWPAAIPWKYTNV